MPIPRLKQLLALMLILLFQGLSSLFSQNLVPNSNFNEHTWCPGGRGLLGWAVPWYSPNRNTTDFCHSCSGSPSYSGVPENRWGTQMPYSGEGYAGIRTWISTEVYVAGKNYREYLAVKLTDSLIRGEGYLLSFKVSVGDNAGFFSDDLGMYLSRDTIASDTMLSFSPQLANPEGNILSNITDWIEISGQFIADGGERFLVIGNFKPDEVTTLVPRRGNDTLFQTTYFYIDDVKVEPCQGRFPETLLYASDSLMCKGETLQLAATDIEGATYEWEDGTTKRVREIGEAGNYQLTVSLEGCMQTDSFNVKQIELPAVQLGADTILCPGSDLLLSVGIGADSYLWSDQSTGTEIWVNTPGIYEVRVQKDKCVLTDQIKVSFEENPGELEGQIIQKCSDTDLILSPSIAGRDYTWQDLDKKEEYTVVSGGTYFVDIASYCFFVRETFWVEEITCSCSSRVPNVFSPNGDGINDIFLAEMLAGPVQYRLEVMDRYGRPVFASTDPATGWDGFQNSKRLPEGVYYWVLQYSCLEGGKNQNKIKKGYVSLLR